MQGRNIEEYFNPCFGKNRLVTTSSEKAMDEIIRRQRNGEGLLVVVCIENYRSLSPLLNNWKERLYKEGLIRSPELHAFEFLPILSSENQSEHEVRSVMKALLCEETVVMLNSIHQASYNKMKAEYFLTELQRQINIYHPKAPLVLNVTENGIIRLMACNKDIFFNTVWLILDEKLACFVNETEPNFEITTKESAEFGTEAEAKTERSAEFGTEAEAKTERSAEFGTEAEAKTEETADISPEAKTESPIECEDILSHSEVQQSKEMSDNASVAQNHSEFDNDDNSCHNQDSRFWDEETEGVERICQKYDCECNKRISKKTGRFYLYWDIEKQTGIFNKISLRLDIIYSKQFSPDNPMVGFAVERFSNRKIIKAAESIGLNSYSDDEFKTVFSFDTDEYQKYYRQTKEPSRAAATFELFIKKVLPLLK